MSIQGLARLRNVITTISTMAPLPAGHPCAECHIRPVAFCRSLGPDTLIDMQALGKPIKLVPGQALFFEGDRVERLFMLARGALKLYGLLGDGRRQITGFMYPGDFLGIALDDQHAFTAEALVACELWSFSREAFSAFCTRHGEVERELYYLAAHELAAAQQQMLLLGRKNAAERLASFFVALAKRFERDPGQKAEHVHLPMSRLDIADYLGLTKETVSRMIAQLRDRKLIRLVNQDTIELLDREGLEDMAAGFGDE